MKKYNYRNKFTHQIQVNHTGEIHCVKNIFNKYFNAKSKSIIVVHFKKGTGILPTEVTVQKQAIAGLHSPY